MQKELHCSFDIVGIEKSESGDYIGMITNNGFTLSFVDQDGNVIPLNKENVEKFLKGKKANELS